MDIKHLKQIIDNAPDGSDYVNGLGLYFESRSKLEEVRSLSDIKTIIELSEQNTNLLGLLEHIKNDLLMRGEKDSQGCTVVDLSSSIWLELNDTLSK